MTFPPAGTAFPRRALALALCTGSTWSAAATLSVRDVVVSQNGCRAHFADFAVRLAGGASQTVDVQYATADGSAVAGTDYSPRTGTLTFRSGTRVRFVRVPVADVAAPGPTKTFSLDLSNPTNATLADAQAVATIRPPAFAKCDDGDACTHDSCDTAARTCRHVNVNACSLPGDEAVCKTPSACAAGHDDDGDGLSNEWETQGGIDFDCNGVLSPNEAILTDVDPVFPDGTANPTPSADGQVKDVFVRYDWMELPDQLTNGLPTACTVTPLPAGPPNFLNIFYPFHSDDCAWDQLCLGGVCKGHSDAPDSVSLQMVVDAFARRGLRLHLVAGSALPHANVASYGPPIPACTADLSGKTFLGAATANFYTLKSTRLPAELPPAFHYLVYAHRHTCDSVADCNKAACANPDTGRPPSFNETGIAEQPGNDILVTLGGFRDRNVAVTTLAEAGTSMHELGHNLGLDHGGPLFVDGVPSDPAQVRLNYKPNYLSVMNYNHQAIGIGTGTAIGDTTSATTRIDYSSFCLPGAPACSSGSHTPNTLDETAGTESNGIGIGTPAEPNNDIGYTWCAGTPTPIPGTGPVDFNCNGSSSETWCDSGCDITPALELNKDPAGGGVLGGDVLQPFEDWSNLTFAFQCAGTYGDGAAPRFLTTGELTSDALIARRGPPLEGRDR